MTITILVEIGKKKNNITSSKTGSEHTLKKKITHLALLASGDNYKVQEFHYQVKISS